MPRYFIGFVYEDGERREEEVTLEEFCKAERRNGFKPKLPSTDENFMTTPATGGFKSGSVEGRVVND